ncbi:MAG: hypothetical protein ABGX16_23590 [Pirellulales bacterium]
MNTSFKSLKNEDVFKLRRRSYVSIKDVCWLLYLYPGWAFARTFPRLLSGLQPVGEFLARRLAKGEQKRLTERLQLAGFGEMEIDSIVKRYLDRAVGRALCDLDLESVTQRLKPSNIHIQGLEYLQSAQESGQGIILISGHFFASRLAKSWLRSSGFSVLSVRHPAPPDPSLGVLGERYLQGRYIRFLNKAIGEEVLIDDPECTLKIVRRLRAGGLVNVHIDAPFASKTQDIIFLGKTHSFSSSVFRIAELAGAAVIPFWFSGDHRDLRIVFEAPLDLGMDKAEELARVIRRLETQVIDKPYDYELWIML